MKAQIQRISQAVKSIFTRHKDVSPLQSYSAANKTQATTDTDTATKAKSKPTAKRSTSDKKKKKQG